MRGVAAGLGLAATCPHPDCFAIRPLPHAGEVKESSVAQTIKMVLATLTRPSFAHHHAKKESPPARMIPKSGVRLSDKIMRTKEGSGAPKGACHPCPRYADKFARTCATHPLRGCAPFRGTPAFRRSRLRYSPPAVTPMAQPQNRVSRRRTSRVFCPLGPLAFG
jgi:hypothetical protein